MIYYLVILHEPVGWIDILESSLEGTEASHQLLMQKLIPNLDWQ